MHILRPVMGSVERWKSYDTDPKKHMMNVR